MERYRFYTEDTAVMFGCERHIVCSVVVETFDFDSESAVGIGMYFAAGGASRKTVDSKGYIAGREYVCRIGGLEAFGQCGHVVGQRNLSAYYVFVFAVFDAGYDGFDIGDGRCGNFRFLPVASGVLISIDSAGGYYDCGKGA